MFIEKYIFRWKKYYLAKYFTCLCHQKKIRHFRLQLGIFASVWNNLAKDEPFLLDQHLS